MASSSSLRSPFSPLTLPTRNPKPAKAITPIRCGPRDNRGPLLKGRILSTEAILAIQALKRAYPDGAATTLNADADDRLSKTLSRLIKSDLIATLNELLRQGRCEIALKVFSAVRSESWYNTDLTLYADMVLALGKKKGMMEDIDRLIMELEEESGGVIECGEGKGLSRLIRALIGAERRESTVRIYGLMKRSGWGSGGGGGGEVDEYVAKVLSRGLRRLGEVGLALEVESALERFERVGA
ncbi:hypothetical protein Dimus_027726 [Dionaea muscipula]